MVVAITSMNDPTGSRPCLAVGSFRREGDGWRFVRRFPNVTGLDLAPGTTVRFGGGRATMVRVTGRPGDPLCCPTGRRTYTLSLR